MIEKSNIIRNSAIAIFLFAERNVYLCFTLLSLILSAWCIYADNIINIDGIFYLSAASLFADGQWAEAFAIYKWPAYSILIGAIIFVSGLEPFYAAQVANAAFDSLSVIIFISIVRLMGGTPRGLIAAGAIIVCHLWVNDMRATIIRDHGYLTFYLLVTYYFLKDVETPQLKSKIACLVAVLTASIFRIEGLVFTASIPIFYAFRQAQSKKGKAITLLFCAAIIVSLPIAIAIWRAGFISFIVNALITWPIETTIASLELQVFAEIPTRIENLRNGILSPFAQDYALAVYIGIVISIVIVGVINSITLLYAPMAIYGLFVKRIMPNPIFITPIAWLALTNIVFLLIFVSQSLFYDWRFGTALSLTLALPATFTLIKTYRFWWFSNPDKIFRNFFVPATAITLAVAFAIEGLPSPSRSRHLKLAAEWMQENIDDNRSVISNNGIFMYYAGRWERQSGPTLGIQPNKSTNYWVSNRQPEMKNIADFEYLAIRYLHQKQEIDDLVRLNPDAHLIKLFDNGRGDHVAIIEIEQ